MKNWDEANVTVWIQMMQIEENESVILVKMWTILNFVTFQTATINFLIYAIC